MFDLEEYQRWVKEAKNTLESAKSDVENKFFNWACFKCQQSAEFSIKGFLYGKGLTPFGHSLTKLIKMVENLGIDISSIVGFCKKLDHFYIPARYPNSYPSGAPFEYYDAQIAIEAVEYAQSVLNFVESLKNEQISKDNEERAE